MDSFLSFVPIQVIESPCVNICRVEAGRCTGCRRTLDEIARWTSMDAAERQRITGELGERST